MRADSKISILKCPAPLRGPISQEIRYLNGYWRLTSTTVNRHVRSTLGLKIGGIAGLFQAPCLSRAIDRSLGEQGRGGDA